MAVFVKIQFGDDVRRVELQSSHYTEFAATLKRLYNLDLEKGYRIFYVDEDKDQINVTSDLELGEAINLAKRMDQTLRLTVKEDNRFAKAKVQIPVDLSASLPNLHSIGSSLLPDSNQKKEVNVDIKKSVSDSQANKSSPVSLPLQPKSIPASHAAQCDNCKARIFGIRYRCVNCEDFDLCETCESKRLHREDHLFLKVYKPVVIPVKILLPNFYEKPSAPETVQTTTTTPTEELPSRKERSKIRENLNGRLVGDVTIPDGTEVAPGVKFTKTWKFRNDGEVAWPSGTRLIQTEGDPSLSRTNFVEVNAAAPGEEVDVSVENTAPSKNGRYVSYWRLSTPNGVYFGHKVWVDIAVVTEKPKPTPAITEEPKKETPKPVVVEQKPIQPIVAQPVAPVPQLPQIPVETPKPAIVETPKPVVVEQKQIVVPPTNNNPVPLTNSNPSPTNPELDGKYSYVTVQFGSEDTAVEASSM